MNSITQWKKHLNNIASELTRRDLFLSEAYTELSQAQCDAMTSGLGKIINENCYDNSPGSYTAYSTGGYININCGYEAIEKEKDDEKALLLLTGLRAHECGHELFTDFPTYSKFYNYLEHAKDLILAEKIDLWRVRDSFKNDLNKMIEDMKKYPHKNNIVTSLIREIQNVFEDAYVNNGIYSYFAGEPSVGLRFLNDTVFSEEEIGTYKELLELCVNGETSIALAMVNIAHLIAIGYPISNKNENFSIEEKSVDALIKNFLEKTKDSRDALPWESDSTKRCQYIAEVLVSLYEYLPDKLPDLSNQSQNQQGENSQQNSNSQGGSSSSGSQQSSSEQNGNSQESQNQKSDENSEKNDGNGSNEQKSEKSEGDSKSNQSANGKSNDSKDDNNGQNQSSGANSESKDGGNCNQGQNQIPDRDLTQEEADKIAKEILELEKQHGKSYSNQGPMMNKPQLDQNKAEKNKNAQMSDTQKRNLDKIAKSLAEQIAKAELESEHAKNLQKEVEKNNDTIINKVGNTPAKNIYLYRIKFYKEMKNEYRAIYKKVEKEANILIRRLKTILKDREVDEYERGHYSGQKVCVKDSAKPGMKVFKKRNEPTGKPKIRVCVLVDESGSMCDRFTIQDGEAISRRDFVRQKAIMLNKVFSELGIEHSIIGHHSSMGNVELRNYVDYENVDDNDQYRLTNITCSGSNADGMCISQCCENLLKTPDRKLLIVLSDGLPSASGYESKFNALEDTIKSVERYRKKGIEIIGSTLVPTNEQYQQIYGNQLIDCSTPEKFDKTFIRLISKIVL